MQYLKTYISSFKSKDTLLILPINILFILLIFGITKLIAILSQGWMDRIDSIDLSNVAFQTEAQLQSIIATLKGFVVFVILTAILFILLTILSWSITQGIIYDILAKKKLSIKYLEKFLLLNMVWFIPWLIIFFIMLLGHKSTYVIPTFYILVLIFMHFSFILYVLFAKENKIRQIKKALKIGITKIHLFILPYLSMIIALTIISRLNLPQIFIISIFLIFFSWIQSYVKDITSHIS